MGAEISTTVLRRLQKETIDDILQDKKLLKVLVDAIPSLSKASKKALRTVTITPTKTKQPKGSIEISKLRYLESPKLRPLVKVTAEDVRLPKAVQLEFQQWLGD
ncbi:ba1cb3ab-d747-4cf6-9411-ecf70619ab53 [Sclerotinia trifoliorum]|uniref:Ba1cb3ab-d747-4cf6-9411-ecf70619ab53 n=1 Tax=Sclerotinia trifoliorum TaxID=28548 RepID=A0A8H2ZQJ3_9HELO|nr:ba1cb3ab-d747-4cf6-9411-ecf70619ab53 [Sclerotinia trifoliorum]